MEKDPCQLAEVIVQLTAMIIFNALGLIFVGLSFGLAYTLCGLLTGEWHGDNAFGYFALGAGSMTLDLAYRAHWSSEPSRWRYVSPSTGGQLFFVPVWALGSLWIVMGGVDIAEGGPKLRAKNDAFMLDSIAILENSAAALANPVDDDRAKDALKDGKIRIRELADFFRELDKAEKKRIDRKFGERVDRLIEQIRLRSVN